MPVVVVPTRANPTVPIIGIELAFFYNPLNFDVGFFARHPVSRIS